jgi:hypothetical protein
MLTYPCTAIPQIVHSESLAEPSGRTTLLSLVVALKEHKVVGLAQGFSAEANV